MATLVALLEAILSSSRTAEPVIAVLTTGLFKVGPVNVPLVTSILELMAVCRAKTSVLKSAPLIIFSGSVLRSASFPDHVTCGV